MDHERNFSRDGQMDGWKMHFRLFYENGGKKKDNHAFETYLERVAIYGTHERFVVGKIFYR